MATTRLRKTFAYPDSDSDPDSEPEGIDEQEQEQLINQFIESDAQKTENYKVCTPPPHPYITLNSNTWPTESVPRPSHPLNNPLHSFAHNLDPTHPPPRHNIASEQRIRALDSSFEIRASWTDTYATPRQKSTHRRSAEEVH